MMDDSEPTENQDNTDVNWKYQPDSQTPKFSGNDTSAVSGVPLKQLPSVSWSASEYVAHEKTNGWYFTLFGGGIFLVAVIFLITKDFLASIVTLLAIVVIGIYGARKPSTKQYLVDENGIQIDNSPHPYREFRSFSVIEEGAINSVWLKPMKRFSPVVAIYFSPEDEQKIIDVLANFLPHEQRELDAIDRLSKKMRF